MGNADDASANAVLEPLVGEWAMQTSFPGTPPGRVSFDWMDGRRFLIQRSDAPDPVPDSISVIGWDASTNRHVQHYFDTRGVARLYQMTFDGREWKLWRDTPDFSPLEFRQRFTGILTDDGRSISGTWDICHDGATWERDIDLNYTKID
ncbi:MAG TPA: hypothetical protein VIG64_01530 [Actinomycetota bacterium]|jgi:hypothetical protein